MGHLAAQWAVEVLFADGKELRGLDQYQVMRAEEIVRFWTVAWVPYYFLDEERAQLYQASSGRALVGKQEQGRDALDAACIVAAERGVEFAGQGLDSGPAEG